MGPGDTKAREIYLQAVAILDRQRRAELLDRWCGGDAALRAQVEDLLGTVKHDDQQPGGDKQDGAAVDQTVIGESIEEVAGTVIGPYKLFEPIGEGGFGIVYMAEQQSPVRRRVALKIIKPGMDTRQVLARFEAERQALAMMDHPNIARAFDAGETKSGRPYFVMELVRGVPITEYCDRNNVSVNDRLELFIQVCLAVQHAHQKGIIHRDIKPSNVLVTLHDGRPVPKIIDFGVAKAINQQLTEKTLFTRFAEMIGTPLYMSPEQAEMTSLDVDTRSDIYSLGVLLYELLTGETPFDRKRLSKASFDEIRRIIREEEPLKPSTRLSTMGEARTVVAARRGSDPGRLRQILRGDLDWIVMKALEKDRTRRYDTASGFADDVRRYLEHRPVEARRASALYRLRRFARRNRVAFMTASLVLAALVIGLVGAIGQLLRARIAEASAQEELDEKSKLVLQLVALRNAEIAERRAAEFEKAKAEANFRKARQAVDEYFTLVSESRLFDVPGLQPLRKQLLEAALKYYEDFVNQRGQEPQLRAALASVLLRVAQSDLQNLQPDAGVQALARSLAIIDGLSASKSPIPGFPQRLAGFAKGGRLLHSWTDLPSDREAALKALHQAAATWERFVRENPGVAGFQSDLALYYHYIGAIELFTEQPKPAYTTFLKASGIWEDLARQAPNTPEYQDSLADSLEYLAISLKDTSRRFEMEAAFLRALGIREKLVAEFPAVPEYRAGLANSLLFLHIALRSFERNADAEKAVRRSLAISEQLAAEFPNSPGYHSQWADASKRLGGLLYFLGRLPESEKAYAQAAELEWNLAAEYGEGPTAGHYCFEYADTCAPLVSLVKAAGRPQEAAHIADRGIALAEKVAKTAPNEWQSLGHTYRLLSSTVQSLNRPADAEQCVRRALPMFEKLAAAYPTRAKDRNYLADTQRMLGDILQAEKQYGAAEEAYRAGLAIYAKTVVDLPREPPNRMDVAQCRSGLANTLAARGRPIEAAELFRQLAKDALHATARPSQEAVQFAQRATELAPQDAKNWSLLASAQDRLADWKAVEAAAKKAIELPEGGTSENEFLLAIAQWQLNNKTEARKSYDKAMAAMAKSGANDGELNGLRAEMEKLLGQ
jgi:serine/threonine protein kinase